MEELGIVSNSLLAALVFSLLIGVLFGMVRGSRRTTVRIITLLTFFLIALLITPMVSGMLYKMNLKLPFFDNKSLYQYITDLKTENSTINNAVTAMPEFARFIENLPVVVFNFIVFAALISILSTVSWVVYLIVAHRFAPKRDSEGEKIPHSKLRGAAMGALQGLVVFFFLSVPLCGLLNTLDKVDSYKPQIAALNTQDTGIEIMDDFNKIVNDINQPIQHSPFGIITKYSGIQFTSGLVMDYLCTVPDVRINVRGDLVKTFEVAKDAAALNQFWGSINTAGDLRGINPKEYQEIKHIINKAFSIKTLKLALDSNVAEFVKTEGLLDDVKLLPSANEEQLELYGARFNDAILAGFGNLNAEFLRCDLIKVVDLMELIFSNQDNAPLERHNLYADLDAVFAAANNKGDIAGACLTLKETLEFNKGGLKIVDRLFKTIADLNLFKNLLVDEDNPDLYRLPLVTLMGLTEQQATITDFEGVMNGIGNILVRLCDVGEATVNLYNSKNFTDFVEALVEDDVVDNLGEILNILTNQMGTKNILRAFAANQLDQILGESGTQTQGVSMNTFTSSIQSKLQSDEDIDWTVELKLIRDIVSLLGIIDFDNLDPDQIVQKLLDGELQELLKESDLISNVIADIIESEINNQLDGTIHIDFGAGDSADIIEIIADAYDGLHTLMDTDPNALDSAAAYDFLLMFGNGNFETAKVNLLKMASGGFVINIADVGLLQSVHACIEIEFGYTSEEQTLVKAMFK